MIGGDYGNGCVEKAKVEPRTVVAAGALDHREEPSVDSKKIPPRTAVEQLEAVLASPEVSGRLGYSRSDADTREIRTESWVSRRESWFTTLPPRAPSACSLRSFPELDRREKNIPLVFRLCS